MSELIAERYVLPKDHVIRQGGMARVARAFDTHTGSVVALKLFSSDLLDSVPVQRHAYQVELRALSQLTHPNIVQILNHGKCTQSGEYFLALPWLDHDLIEELRNIPLTGWDDYSQRIGTPVLNALVFAHLQQVAHRDLKPSNIMFDASLRRAVVTDFGIARFCENEAVGLTLRDFRSKPFCPPSDEPSTKAMARDVFSFGAVSVQSLWASPIEDYETLYHALTKVDVPSNVRDILADCLSDRVDNRIQTAIELQEAFKEIRSTNKAPPKRQLSIPVTHCRPTVVSTVQSAYDCSESTAREILFQLLNTQAYIRYADDDSDEKRKLQIVLDAFSIFATEDTQVDGGLILITAFPVSPQYVSRMQAFSVRSQVQFVQSDHLRADDLGPAGFLSLLNQLEHFQQNAKAQSASVLPHIFDVWNNILQAKDDLARNKHPDIQFSSASHTGFFVDAIVDVILPDDLIDEVYFCRTIRDEVLHVRVVETVGHSIRLAIEGSVDLDFPESGTLKYDLKRHDAAIKKQQECLESTAQGRIVNPKIAEVIRTPRKAEKSTSPISFSPIISKLDEAKIRTVERFLRSEDVFLVVGPPGTGKTELIAEVILQTLEKTPNARILLTGQTHNSVDNAIVRLREIQDSKTIVRIGNASQDKISTDVTDLLIQKAAQNWAERVRKRSLDGLDSVMRDSGEDIETIRLIVTEKEIRTIFNDIKVLESQASNARNQLKLLEEKRRNQSAQQGATETAKIETEGEDLRETLDEILSALKSRQLDLVEAEERSAVFGVQSQEMRQLSDADFEDWWKLASENNTNIDVRAVIKTVDEWLSRLSYSPELLPAVLLDSQIVAGTCLGFSMSKGVMEIDFDLVIVDEASKVSSTEILVPMSRAKRVLLVGDNKQLPPFIENELLDEDLLAERGLTERDVRSTLFEELERSLPTTNKDELTIQYRMSRPISDLVSRCFYGGSLQTYDSPKDKRSAQLGIGLPVQWHDTSRRNDRRESGRQASFSNSCEVAHILRRLRYLENALSRKNVMLSVVLLTPYGRQKSELLKLLERYKRELTHMDISVETVHAYQGREADVCMLSLVRSNLNSDIGFLKAESIINVALSRARIQLQIFGDARFFESVKGKNPLSDVIRYIKNGDGCEIIQCY